LGYIQFFLKDAAPWSVLFLVALPWLGIRYVADRESLAKPALLFLVTGLIILLAFLFSSTKIVWYLLPAYPFIAIGLALGFGYLYSRIGHRVIALGVLSVLVAGGLWTAVNFAFHIRPDLHNNDMIVKDEYEAGLILAANPQPREVYTLAHYFYDTVEYYSGGRELNPINLGQQLDHSFYLITPTSLTKAHPFDPSLEPHMEKLFEGPKLSLYRFTR
jgi:hypothetical protein